MNASQDQAGKKWKNEELNNFHLGPLPCLLKSLSQDFNIVIEQLEVIGDLRLASDRRHHHDNFSSGHAGDALWCLRIEVWLNQFVLRVLAFHVFDQLDRMRRRRSNSLTGYDVNDHIESKLLGEIRPCSVIS